MDFGKKGVFPQVVTVAPFDSAGRVRVNAYTQQRQASRLNSDHQH